jgi:tetratricopeptide (TPR) repeat protein
MIFHSLESVSPPPGGRSRRRLRLLFAVSVTLGLAALLGICLIFTGGGSSSSERLRMSIDEELAKLDPKPPRTELISTRALRVRNAIKRGDYAAARQTAAEVIGASQLENWRYYPFSDFIVAITDTNDPAFEAQLNEWIAEDPRDSVPRLIRAQYFHDKGWLKRGNNFSRDTMPAHMSVFTDYMKKALTDINAAIYLNDGGNPYGFYLKLRILRGFGASPDMTAAFETAVAKYPAYYSLYEIALDTLQPRWGGSSEAMYAFVDRYAGNAGEHSPLKLLYLRLYQDLLSSASVVCTQSAHDRNQLSGCVASGMETVITASLQTKIVSALELYDQSDRHQFNVAVESILSGMLKTRGGDRYSGMFLELAANGMRSDTRLVEDDKPIQNNYVIDRAVAESWYAKGFYDNAIKKYQEARKDIEHASFPNEEERALALSAIYDDLAGGYNKVNQYVEMIAYEKAALLLGGKARGEPLICYGYYKLKHYEAAVQACTAAIERTGDLQARYWRGVAYRDSGEMDAALEDLRVVADSEYAFRTAAAIDMSVIYGKRKEAQRSLEVLNKYAYLYDQNKQSKENLAASYNNRCYAYMELGELTKALEECTASLKYGSLPDAVRKQQELTKRLKAAQFDPSGLERQP